MNARTTVHPQAAQADDDSAPATADEAPATAPRRSHAVRRWVARVISFVATLAVVGIVGLALALTAVPAAVGGHALTVLSGSMVPEFSPGAMVVDRPAEATSLQVGDIVTYATTDEVSGAPILITHRIVEVQAGPTFITQGDANNSPDSRPVDASQIQGKVWYSVPYVGNARNFLLAQGSGLIVGGAAGLILAVWLLLQALKPDPEPAAATESSEVADQPGAGQHRARNGATVAALVGLLATGSQLAPHQPATQAAFSDQASVQFSITVGSTAPAGQTANSNAPAATAPGPAVPGGNAENAENAENAGGSSTPAGRAVGSEAPAGDPTGSAIPADETAERVTPAEETVGSETPAQETVDGAAPAEDTVGSESPTAEPDAGG